MAQLSILWTIFGLVYLGMALGRLPGLGLDRTGISLLGAVAMVAVGGVTVPQAAHAIDLQTILLLFALMLFSSQLRAAGFYRLVGEWLARETMRPKRLLASLVIVSAFLSALLANDIVCLAFTPVLCDALRKARRDPIPYLVALATSCNLGSAATIIGNPQNMYIGTVGQLRFAHFSMVMTPVTLVSLAIGWGIILLMWRRDFFDGMHDGGVWAQASVLEELVPVDRVTIVKTLVILVGLVVAFVMLPEKDRVAAALGGGALLLISKRRDSAHLYERTDWDLLLLFFGLFVVNGTMQQPGRMDRLMAAVAHSGVDLHRLPVLAGVTMVLSNLVSNVPAVLLLKPSVPDTHAGWYILAMASTWAGNLTLVGSIANLIVAEQAACFGVKLDLKSYCRAGIPLAILSVGLGTVWIMRVMS